MGGRHTKRLGLPDRQNLRSLVSAAEWLGELGLRVQVPRKTDGWATRGGARHL